MLRDLKGLERDLDQVKSRLAALSARDVQRGECSHGRLDELARLTESLRAAERAVCAARGEDFALVWQEGLSLRRSALPQLFQDRDRLTVLAVVQHVSPEWKGRFAGEGLRYAEDSPIVRIQYRGATAQRINSAPVESHPLFGRGLDPTQMMQVIHRDGEPDREHHLLMFDGAWIEIRGVPIAVEVWPDRLDDIARHSAGRPL